MSTKISSLAEATAPDENVLVPMLVSGVTRKAFLSNVLSLVTGGTAIAANVTGGTNISVVSAGVSSTKQLTISFNLPGIIVPYSGPDSTVPASWLFCNGQAISRSTYAALFGVISTTYGVGDGTNTFNVPDLRGRIPFGKATSSGSSSPLNGAIFSAGNFYTLASAGGEETHLLTSGQTPIKDHTHTAAGTMTVYGSSTDTSNFDAGGCTPPENYSDNGYLGEVAVGTQKTSTSTVTSTALTALNASLSHTNVPPVIVLNYLIKT